MNNFIVGLDLGSSQDFTAVAILERVGNDYHCRDIRRFELQTPYPEIVRTMAAMFDQPPISGGVLAVDMTGCGQPVVEMLAEAKIKGQLHGIKITGGSTSTRKGNHWNVSKLELVSALVILFQNGRLRLAAELPGLEDLLKELRNFQVKVTAANNETFSSWRDSIHDDMVLALGVGIWLGERLNTFNYSEWRSVNRSDNVEDGDGRPAAVPANVERVARRLGGVPNVRGGGWGMG